MFGILSCVITLTKGVRKVFLCKKECNTDDIFGRYMNIATIYKLHKLQIIYLSKCPNSVWLGFVL